MRLQLKARSMVPLAADPLCEFYCYGPSTSNLVSGLHARISGLHARISGLHARIIPQSHTRNNPRASVRLFPCDPVFVATIQCNLGSSTGLRCVWKLVVSVVGVVARCGHAGAAKEGGQLKVTGGNKFELLQDYREYSRPGASSYEEIEDAPIRSFEVRVLTRPCMASRPP